MANSTIHENGKNLVIFTPITRSNFYTKDRNWLTWPEKFPLLAGTDAQHLIETREEYEIEFDELLALLAHEAFDTHGADHFLLYKTFDPQDPAYFVELVGYITREGTVFGLRDPAQNIFPLIDTEDVFTTWLIMSKPELQALNNKQLPKEFVEPILKKRKMTAEEKSDNRILAVANLKPTDRVSLQTYFLRNRKALYKELTDALYEIYLEMKSRSSLRKKPQTQSLTR